MNVAVEAVVGSVVLLPFATYVIARMATKAYFFSKREFIINLKKAGY